ncbi:BF3164 family lipoprotein [Bacteroides sp. 224]|uniref:BF3164 family lipoprotein n=1 Tax=Bacteroides sp. 224 TaxID=2302936 RepID=UPI0013D621EB|nr:BF3164 family lipoprotein [Bacteroides sp. 224]NDV66540.1 hypothetical protein [Bacteroides sp. 224]
MKTYPFLILVLLLSGCFSNPGKKKQAYTDFPETVELTGTIIDIDTALFRYPFRICVEKDRALVLDLHNLDYYYHLFTYPDFVYLNSFGKRGNAPGELISAENMRVFSKRVLTLDANKRELTTWNFSQNRDSLLLENAFPLNEGLLRPLDFTVYNDSIFIIPDYSGENRLCWVNLQEEIVQKTGEIPTDDKSALENTPIAVSQAWRSFIDYNPRNGILAAVTQLGEVLEIYNLKDTTYMAVMGPHGEPQFRKMKGGNAAPIGIMGFSDVQVGDSCIYAVFHGRSFKDIAQSKKQLPDGGQFIYVFDFQGNPLRKYILDCYINGISIDEEAGIILATDVNNDQPIVSFSF